MEIQKTAATTTPLNGAITQELPTVKTCPNHPTKVVWARGVCDLCYQKDRHAQIKAGTWQPDPTKSAAMLKAYARKQRRDAKNLEAAAPRKIARITRPPVTLDTFTVTPAKVEVLPWYKRIPAPCYAAAGVAAAIVTVLLLKH